MCGMGFGGGGWDLDVWDGNWVCEVGCIMGFWDLGVWDGIGVVEAERVLRGMGLGSLGSDRGRGMGWDGVRLFCLGEAVLWDGMWIVGWDVEYGMGEGVWQRDGVGWNERARFCFFWKVWYLWGEGVVVS